MRVSQWEARGAGPVKPEGGGVSAAFIWAFAVPRPAPLWNVNSAKILNIFIGTCCRRANWQPATGSIEQAAQSRQQNGERREQRGASGKWQLLPPHDVLMDAWEAAAESHVLHNAQRTTHNTPRTRDTYIDTNSDTCRRSGIS